MSNETTSGETVEAAASHTQSQEASTQDQERMVPLAALEAERAQRQSEQAERQKVEDDLSMIKEHLKMLQARQQAPAQPQDMHDEDDVVTYRDLKKERQEVDQYLKRTLGELYMSKKHPDYEDVVKKYLPEVIKEDPSLARTLEATQDYNLAYRLAKSSEGYRRDHHQTQRNEDATRLVENSTKAGSLSSVGGTTPISMAKRYKDMSDADFRREVAKNMGYA